MNKEAEPQKPSSSKPLCLANMSSKVLQILKENGSTTFTAVADLIVEDVQSSTDTTNNQRTTRRRVYDVLNVFHAAGLITKDSKTITFNPYDHTTIFKGGSNDSSQIEARINTKQKALLDKIKLLIYYKLLIERNKKRQRPTNAIQLQALFVGFDDVGNGQAKRSLDGRQLEIVANSPPQFFSPMMIFERMTFSPESQLGILQNMPNFSAYEPLLFPAIYKKPANHVIQPPKKVVVMGKTNPPDISTIQATI